MIKNTFIKKFVSAFTILSILALYAPTPVNAATVTAFSDTMSSQVISATANHVLGWTLVGGDTVAAADTFAVDFVNADFTLNAIGSWQTTDFTFNDGTARTVTAVSTTSGVAPTCTGGANNVAITIDTTNNTFTVVACATYTPSAANPTIAFTINGTTAAGTGTMTNKNADVNSSLVSLTQSNGDVASGAVAVETNDIVTVTATVAPTLVFAISSATVALGTLTSATTGTGSHTVSVASNAGSGFNVTYNGATLTSGANTIAAYGALQSSVAGTAGFGINLKANTTPSVGTAVTTNTGTCGIATNYNTINSFSYVASTTTPVTAVTAPADCVYTVSYIANISTTTPAGAYSTPITYVATGTF